MRLHSVDGERDISIEDIETDKFRDGKGKKKSGGGHPDQSQKNIGNESDTSMEYPVDQSGKNLKVPDDSLMDVDKAPAQHTTELGVHQVG